MRQHGFLVSRLYCTHYEWPLAWWRFCLSVCLWRCAQWQMCINKRIGSAVLGTPFYNFHPLTPTLTSQSPPPKFTNFFNSGLWPYRTSYNRIGSPQLPTGWYNISLLHVPYSLKLATPKISTSVIAVLSMLAMAILDNGLQLNRMLHSKDVWTRKEYDLPSEQQQMRVANL